MKELLKKLLAFLNISVTRNQRYDADTRAILRKILNPDSNGIDIGCHKGEILDLMLKSAPQGKLFAFEPIPVLFQSLVSKYISNPNVRIFNTALYDTKGTTSFQHVVNAPAYSGIKKRVYDGRQVNIKPIMVQTDLLDNILPSDVKVDLIKIDVEGAELPVMRGSLVTIRRNRPVIIFECGLGASEFYGTKPDMVFDFLTNDCGLFISTLRGFLAGPCNLSRAEFKTFFETGSEYYFVAHP